VVFVVWEVPLGVVDVLPLLSFCKITTRMLYGLSVGEELALVPKTFCSSRMVRFSSWFD
jgi:hypothetical protein